MTKMFFPALFLLSLHACSPKHADISETRKGNLWLTTGDGNTRLKQMQPLVFQQNAESGLPLVEIDASTEYQKILGFGATMTGSSAFVLSHNLNEVARKQVMDSLFSREHGIGLSYLRMTIGASDFSSHNYSYLDPPEGVTDTKLKYFTIEPDKVELIPRLKEAMQINPDIEVMGSPWSAPASWKTTGNMIGGKLKTGVQPAFANYLIQYIKSFGAEGVKISAITIQNEPEFEPPGYPGMLMTAEEQRDLIKGYLGPKFLENDITTKIVVYDHNWDHPNYPISILDDPQARQFVDGSAFHCYGGDVANQSKVHDAHPDKNIYFTECSSGGWSGPWRDDLMWKFKNLMIGNLRNWATCVLLWNLALDENSGPVNGGCMDCRGVVTVRSDGTYEPTIDYYSLGHLSRFVRKGAVRIASTDLSAQNLDNVAFKNPDGSKVLVLMNNKDMSRKVNVKATEGVAEMEIPAFSVITLVW
ncbi:MAG: glycosyl hydrolase [Saprospiraceae bacterium]|nr:glycosyl hydrolase [Saprospiraceae bacterium]